MIFLRQVPALSPLDSAGVRALPWKKGSAMLIFLSGLAAAALAACLACRLPLKKQNLLLNLLAALFPLSEI